MEYRSQKIAYWYFAAALPLFVLQVVVGLWLAANYTFTIPQSIVNVFPFSTARAIHTNLLVLWMLLGFMGGTYYIIPEETKSEIYSTNLAWFQLIALLATGVTAIVGFLFGWTQGRPLLEIPMALDFVVVIGALVFLFNVGMTMLKAKNWTVIQGTLLGGLVFLALLYLFGIPFYQNLVIDWYYWWWVIHLWVEGAWELVTAAIFAFVLMKLTGVEREVVEKWLYVEIGLFMFTGLAGTGHHYYWLGAPRYWLWIGGIFSALEPLPIILMVFDTMHHVTGEAGIQGGGRNRGAERGPWIPACAGMRKESGRGVGGPWLAGDAGLPEDEERDDDEFQAQAGDMASRGCAGDQQGEQAGQPGGSGLDADGANGDRCRRTVRQELETRSHPHLQDQKKQ